MGKSVWRKMVSGVLMLAFPASLLAADSGAAMLYTNGAAWVNGAHVPRNSSAIFSGDTLQTRSDTVANIDLPGSKITILADSLVEYRGGSVEIDHGAVAVSTSKRLDATAGDVKVTPASLAWTEFNVTDTDGDVHIVASKGALLVTDANGVTKTLQQGQQTTTPESSQDADNANNTNGKKRKKKEMAGANPAAQGGILNSPWAVGGGAIAVAGLTTWVLTRSSAPASPSQP
jgi:ferric-dicitrate binding protein FerR (iron transport regulator)